MKGTPMRSESRKLLNEMLKYFSDLDYVHPEDIPNIDLYVDQVTTFIDSQLASVKRNPEDKTLTKTMINNYTKNHVLPSPNKKKYSRDHVLTLIFIYYFKNFLSIKDIQEILNPITDKYFGKDSDLSFFDVYSELVSLESTEARALVKDMIAKYNTSRQIFTDAPEEDQELLQNFTFICMLGFDVYIKKTMIEEFIDMSRASATEAEKEEE
jgi:DNA-binding transcriptional MerR regulator